jgi:hypothetical protein
MSLRQAAKVLGVSQSMIRDDVSRNHSKNDQKSLTGNAATKARRAEIAATAASWRRHRGRLFLESLEHIAARGRGAHDQHR